MMGSVSALPPLLLPLLLLSPAAAGLAADDLERALGGGVPLRTETFTRPDGQSAGRGLGAIVIERPIAEVWATLSHYEDKAEYQPRLKTVTVLDRQPGLLRVRMEVDASVTTARYTGLFHLDEAEHRIRWELDRSAADNTVADVDGDYRMFEVSAQRTLLVYRTYVDAGRAVPGFIQTFLTRRSIPNLLRAIKRRIESGGTWRK